MSVQVLHGFTAKEALGATHEPCYVSTLYLRVKQERERIVSAEKQDNTTENNDSYILSSSSDIPLLHEELISFES